MLQHLHRFVRLVVGLLFVTNLALSTLGCSLTLGQQYPQARVWNVCALPESMELQDDRTWLYAPDGTLIPRANTIGFERLAPKVRDIFVFDLEASKDSPLALPSPDNQLECQTGFSWLNPEEVEDAPVTGCRGNCQLPKSAVMFEPCPIQPKTRSRKHALGWLEELQDERERPDVRLFGQTELPVRSGFLQPVGAATYAPNCATLVRQELKKQIRDESLEYGKRVANAIGSAMAGWNTFAESGNELIRDTFVTDPQVIATYQNYVAYRLNELPEPSEYDDPELAGIALVAFEKGYGETLTKIQAQFTAFNAACTALILASGPIASTVETVAAKGLRLALARMRAMPIFLPASIGGGAFLRRLPKPPSSGSNPTFIKPRTPAPEPGVRRPVAAPPAAKTNPAPTNSTPTTTITTQPTPSGQLHHGISEKVFRALESRPNLKCKFKLRDPQFTARAATPDAHNGYQKWHEALDDEVVAYILGKKDLSPKDFAAWLYKRYRQPDLAHRFPGGLGTNK